MSVNLAKSKDKANVDKLIFWEMNEINFNYVDYYINQGKLRNWKKFISKHGLYATTSEKKYEELEPWIQWPTVRSGLSYNEHGIFRLGDVIGSGLKQHWEILESEGFSVSALSPINASNNTNKSPFWIPDPWVDTKISGQGFVLRIAKAIKQAVNDNAEEKLDTATLITILEGVLTKSQLSSWPQYLLGLFGALKKQHWSKAIILDRLLADIFINLWKKHQPDFSVLFLNSGAHIQHHYMCSSAAYNGDTKNPIWYVKRSKDPLLEILELYDAILSEIQKLENTRLMVAVGLQQVPYEKPAFYWRLKDHGQFLTKIGITFKRIQPRMTRDFLIEFNDNNELYEAEKLLLKVKAKNGDRIFGEIESRKNSLFVSLDYSDNIDDHFSIYIGITEYKNFKNDVAFVAIKNGHHDPLGYFLDNYRSPNELENDIPLKKIFSYIMDHFEVINYS